MKNITVDKKEPMHEFLWRLAGGKPGVASLNLEPETPESESAPALSPAMVMSPDFKEKV
jgi:hypothetical protein